MVFHKIARFFSQNDRQEKEETVRMTDYSDASQSTDRIDLELYPVTDRAYHLIKEHGWAISGPSCASILLRADYRMLLVYRARNTGRQLTVSDVKERCDVHANAVAWAFGKHHWAWAKDLAFGRDDRCKRENANAQYELKLMGETPTFCLPEEAFELDCRYAVMQECGQAPIFVSPSVRERLVRKTADALGEVVGSKMSLRDFEALRSRIWHEMIRIKRAVDA